MDMDASTVSECDFVLNDGEVTILGDVSLCGDSFSCPSKPAADAKMDAKLDVKMDTNLDAKMDSKLDDKIDTKMDAKIDTKLDANGKPDGSDSGVELSGPAADRDTDTPLAGTPVLPGPPAHAAHLDYDGTSEGGSESSSVLSHTPVRKKISSASGSTSCSTPGRGHAGHPQGHPGHPHARSRSVVASGTASGPAPPGSTGSPAPRPRERSAASRGASCSRGRQSSVSGSDAGAPTASRMASSRSQRLGSGSGTSGTSSLMTSSLTGSLTMSSNVRGRGTTRAPAAPRPAPRVASSAASGAATSTDDGRWPSTVQRPTTLCRTRASSVAAERDRRATSMTSSSSKNSVNSTNSASTPSPTVESKAEKFCTLPRRRRRRSVESAGGDRASTSQSSRKPKVTLYHETGAQTALTIQDLDDLLVGKTCQLRPIDAKEQSHQGVQVDRERDDFATLMLDRRLKAIIDMLGFEHSGAPRSPGSINTSITSTVQTPPKEIDHTAWMKSLELLEQRAATIKKRDLQQRNEIGRLRYEVEHTERLRKQLLSQQEETEAETSELQEFLQVEKSMLAESLKEAEKEVQAHKKIAEGLNEELERQREECQHLVRISEQRRQEVLTLQARVSSLEQRSRDSLLQQGAAVSGASVALSALSSRLDELAIQLEESSVDKALSALTTEAEAVTTRTKEVCRPISLHLENNFQSLDNVTEPELEEEGGGQRDSVSTDNCNSTSLVNSESIQNLSAAILFRRLQEEAIKSETSTSTDDAPGHLIDQVLDVDTLITRVLRAISDAVHSKTLPLSASEEQNPHGTIQQKVESKVLQKIEDHSETTKPNHIPIFNGSSEGSCGEGKSMSVSLAAEPVTGAA